MSEFEDFTKGQLDAQEMLNRNFDEVRAQLSKKVNADGGIITGRDLIWGNNNRRVGLGGSATDFDFAAGRIAIRLEPANISKGLSACAMLRDTANGALLPIATATPPEEHPLALEVGVSKYRKCTYSKAQDSLVIVSFNTIFPSSDDRIKAIATLPPGYRPAERESAVCIAASPGNVMDQATVEVEPWGVLQVYANTAGFTNATGKIVFYASTGPYPPETKTK